MDPKMKLPLSKRIRGVFQSSFTAAFLVHSQKCLIPQFSLLVLSTVPGVIIVDWLLLQGVIKH